MAESTPLLVLMHVGTHSRCRNGIPSIILSLLGRMWSERLMSAPSPVRLEKKTLRILKKNTRGARIKKCSHSGIQHK